MVPTGSVYAFLAAHRGEVFPDGLFADLFPSGRGRPSVPGEVIASVLVLQTLEDRSDAEAMTSLRCDLRWKVACGLPIDHEGFHVRGPGRLGLQHRRRPRGLAEAGHTAIKPMPLRPAVEGGFTLDDFTVDEQTRTVTCPNGLTWPITPARNVTFGVACRRHRGGHRGRTANAASPRPAC